MRIGINALSITPDSTGGGTTYILELVKHLSLIDQENTYVLFVRKDSRHHFEDYGSNFGFKEIPMPARFSVPFRVFIDLFVMSILAARQNLDVLFSPVDSVPLWLSCASVMVIQNLLYFHSAEARPMADIQKRKFHTKVRLWYYNLTVKRSAQKADRIVTVSQNAKKEIVENLDIDGSKISVVYHGVGSGFAARSESNDTRESLSRRYKIDREYILYVGALVPYKNIEGLLEAFSQVKNRMCKLVIAGADFYGYEAHLRTVAEHLNISDRVQFIGYVPYEELPELYENAKASVLLSLCESFGLPVIEAMACGCPVICSNVSTLPEIAGDAAILVDPHDPKAAANAIDRLLEDEQYRRNLISRGKKRASEFSWQETASQTLLAIRQAVKDRQQ